MQVSKVSAEALNGAARVNKGDKKAAIHLGRAEQQELLLPELLPPSGVLLCNSTGLTSAKL